MPDRFDGKVAVVTGGSTGIGAAIALRLAGEGAKVLTCARNQPPEPLGDGISFERADVTNPTDIERVVRQAIDRHGRSDDVAAAEAFHASEEAAFITGTILDVDGGAVAKL